MGKPDTGGKRSFFHLVKPKSHQLPYVEFGLGPENRFNPTSALPLLVALSISHKRN
jgi:hypothetical protein